MEYTLLGQTGLEVSRLCLGTWRFGRETDGTVETTREEAHELLDAAWDRGINFFDTANVYGDPSGTAERWIGEWLDDHDRHDAVIASKVYWDFERGHPHRGGLSRRDVRRHLEDTLDRLGTDYLDVYYLHRWDDRTPITQTLRTMNDLVREGRVNHVAASTMAAWKLTKGLWKSDLHGLERFEVTQPKFNAAYRDEVADYLDVCADQDLAVCPYSPLHGGFLTGKYERDGTPPEGSRGDLESWEDEFTEREWRVLDAIREIANEVDATPTQVALRWLVDRDRFTCVPIVGARSVDQLDENCGVVDVTLTRNQLRRIDEAYTHHQPRR